MQAAVQKMEEMEYHPERLLQPEDVGAGVFNALNFSRTCEVTDTIIRPYR